MKCCREMRGLQGEVLGVAEGLSWVPTYRARVDRGLPGGTRVLPGDPQLIREIFNLPGGTSGTP